MHALPLAQGIIGFIREDFQISFLFLSLYCSTLQVSFPTFVYIVPTYLLPFLVFRGTLKTKSVLDPFQDIFVPLAHETTCAPSGNHHLFTISCHRQTYQYFQQSPQRLQCSDFQSPFSPLKTSGIFMKKTLKNTKIGCQLLFVKVFKNFVF